MPIIAEDSWPSKPDKANEIKAILRAIILRWHEAQSGAVTGKTQAAEPYSQALQLDARPKRGYTLMPYEGVDLQRVVRVRGGMFSVNTTPENTEPP